MKKTFYDIREYNAQISIRRREHLNKLVPGCGGDDTEPVLVARYDNEQAARAHLNKLATMIDVKDSWASGSVAMVREYQLECIEVEVDDDGEEEYISTLWSVESEFPTRLYCCGEWFENDGFGWELVDDEEAEDDE